MEKFLSTETIILELLLVVIVVAIAVRQFRVPYTVALVLVGLALTLQRSIQVDLTSGLILALFVPPLVFEAALGINFNQMRRDLPRILLLAVPGVIVTTLVVAGLFNIFSISCLSSGLGIRGPDLSHRPSCSGFHVPNTWRTQTVGDPGGKRESIERWNSDCGLQHSHHNCINRPLQLLGQYR